MDVLERFKQNPDDKDAQEALFLQYRRLLYRLAARYSECDSAIDKDDLVQEAFPALLRAAKTHDPSSDKSFLSWCSLYVRGAMLKSFPRRRIVNEDGKKVYRLQPIPVYLDEPLNEEGDKTRGELLADEKAVVSADRLIRQEIRAEVRKAVDALPPINAQIVRRHYLDGKPLSQTAEEMGIRKDEAQAADIKALQQLRRMKGLQILATDLNYYRGKTAAAFHRDNTSETEDLALRRIAIKEKYGLYPEK